MQTSERDAVWAVELAIMACEGGLTVDRIRYDTVREAAIARRWIAEMAVGESTLLRRWVAIRPPCFWCGEAITVDDHYIEVEGVQVHSSNGRPCSQEYLGRVHRYCSTPPGRQLYLVHGP
jgi:hypothetical protein